MQCVFVTFKIAMVRHLIELLKLLNFLNFLLFLDTTTAVAEPIEVLPQNDDPQCRDEFSNCAVVIKAKLCAYHYYNEKCCHSCKFSLES